MRTLFFLFVMTFISLNGWTASTSIDDDGMLLLDGKRTFIVGLYETAETDDFAQEVSAAGFNLIRAHPLDKNLNRAKEHNLQSWIPLHALAVSSTTEEEKLRSLIQTYKDHPALSVWEAPDEALWNVWWRRWNRAITRWNQVESAIQSFSGSEEKENQINKLQKEWYRYRDSARYAQAEEIESKLRILLGLPAMEEKLSQWNEHIEPLRNNLARGCEIIREEDPNHVIWFNHAPRNQLSDLRKFGELADVVGCDIYPVPFGPDVGHSDLPERNLPTVGRYTDRMRKASTNEAVWMVLQGFGWDDLLDEPPKDPRPRPTTNQLRYMAFDAIIHKARGILYWGTFAVEKESLFWMNLLKVVSELDELQPFLSARDMNQGISISPNPSPYSSESGVKLLAKKHNHQWALFLINESTSALAFDITGLNQLNGTVFHSFYDEETLTVDQGKITYGIPAMSYAVLISH